MNLQGDTFEENSRKLVLSEIFFKIMVKLKKPQKQHFWSVMQWDKKM